MWMNYETNYQIKFNLAYLSCTRQHTFLSRLQVTDTTIQSSDLGVQDLLSMGPRTLESRVPESQVQDITTRPVQSDRVLDQGCEEA